MFLTGRKFGDWESESEGLLALLFLFSGKLGSSLVPPCFKGSAEDPIWPEPVFFSDIREGIVIVWPSRFPGTVFLESVSVRETLVFPASSLPPSNGVPRLGRAASDSGK